jgi:hypothetical protein
MAQNVPADRSRRSPKVGRRTMLTVLGVGVLALAFLVYVSTDNVPATVTTVVILVAVLLAGWALTVRSDRRRLHRRPGPLDEARAALDVEKVRAARVEHGESAGITEIRRQVPSLTYEQAVELHRYV